MNNVKAVSRQSGPNESERCAIVNAEGHPRSNGDGPLTRKSFSRNDRSFG